MDNVDATSKKIAVELTPFEWHRLLSDLEYLLRISNRENESTVNLIEIIIKQLA